MEDKRIIALQHFDLATNFFHVVEIVLTETITVGNLQNYVGPPIEDIQKVYKQMTNWSDFRVIIPILFNFFHGLELNLKGINYLTEIPCSKKINHRLSDLFEKFKENHSNQTTLINIFNYYIFPNASCEILKTFYETNEIIDSSQFYEIFRYPYTKEIIKSFDYKDIRNLGEKGISFYQKIIDDIDKIRDETKMIAMSFRT